MRRGGLWGYGVVIPFVVVFLIVFFWGGGG